MIKFQSRSLYFILLLLSILCIFTTSQSITFDKNNFYYYENSGRRFFHVTSTFLRSSTDDTTSTWFPANSEPIYIRCIDDSTPTNKIESTTTTYESTSNSYKIITYIEFQSSAYGIQCTYESPYVLMWLVEARSSTTAPSPTAPFPSLPAQAIDRAFIATTVPIVSTRWSTIGAIQYLEIFATNLYFLQTKSIATTTTIQIITGSSYTLGVGIEIAVCDNNGNENTTLCSYTNYKIACTDAFPTGYTILKIKAPIYQSNGDFFTGTLQFSTDIAPFNTIRKSSESSIYTTHAALQFYGTMDATEPVILRTIAPVPIANTIDIDTRLTNLEYEYTFEVKHPTLKTFTLIIYPPNPSDFGFIQVLKSCSSTSPVAFSSQKTNSIDITTTNNLLSFQCKIFFIPLFMEDIINTNKYPNLQRYPFNFGIESSTNTLVSIPMSYRTNNLNQLTTFPSQNDITTYHIDIFPLHYNTIPTSTNDKIIYQTIFSTQGALPIGTDFTFKYTSNTPSLFQLATNFDKSLIGYKINSTSLSLDNPTLTDDISNIQFQWKNITQILSHIQILSTIELTISTTSLPSTTTSDFYFTNPTTSVPIPQFDISTTIETNKPFGSATNVDQWIPKFPFEPQITIPTHFYQSIPTLPTRPTTYLIEIDISLDDKPRLYPTTTEFNNLNTNTIWTTEPTITIYPGTTIAFNFTTETRTELESIANVILKTIIEADNEQFNKDHWDNNLIGTTGFSLYYKHNVPLEYKTGFKLATVQFETNVNTGIIHFQQNIYINDEYPSSSYTYSTKYDIGNYYGGQIEFTATRGDRSLYIESDFADNDTIDTQPTHIFVSNLDTIDIKRTAISNDFTISTTAKLMTYYSGDAEATELYDFGIIFAGVTSIENAVNTKQIKLPPGLNFNDNVFIQIQYISPIYGTGIYNTLPFTILPDCFISPNNINEYDIFDKYTSECPVPVITMKFIDQFERPLQLKSIQDDSKIITLQQRSKITFSMSTSKFTSTGKVTLYYYQLTSDGQDETIPTKIVSFDNSFNAGNEITVDIPRTNDRGTKRAFFRIKVITNGATDTETDIDSSFFQIGDICYNYPVDHDDFIIEDKWKTSSCNSGASGDGGDNDDDDGNGDGGSGGTNKPNYAYDVYHSIYIIITLCIAVIVHLF